MKRHLLATVMLLQFVVVLLVSLGSTPAVAIGPACTDPGRAEIDPITEDVVPVVMVHGWTGNAAGMQPLGEAIEQEFGDQVAIRYFDYQADSSDWAAEPAISACLAEFVVSASDQTGRPAVIVAHSMGGLAARFASSPDYAQQPLTADQLSDVVTIDTPHTGSPWGGSVAAEVVQYLAFAKSWGAVPAGGSGAACLAQHTDGADLPDGCAAPPYFPVGTNLLAIEGSNTVHRDLFGIRLWSVDHRGDGIVLSNSMSGYPGSAGQPTPTGYRLDFKTVSCEQGSSQVEGILRGMLNPKHEIFRAWLRTFTDNVLMDEIADGRVGLLSGPQWLATHLTSDCGHGAVLTHPDTQTHTTAIIQRALENDQNDRVGSVELDEVLVPAYCDQPERAVVEGAASHGEGLGETRLEEWDDPFVWEPEPGVQLRVVPMSCTAGGVSWPGVLLFYDDQGNRVAEFFLADLVDEVFRGSFVVPPQDSDKTLAVTLYIDRGSDGSTEAVAQIEWSPESIDVSHVQEVGGY